VERNAKPAWWSVSPIRVLKLVSLVCGSLALIAVLTEAAREISISWLTPLEKRAASDALRSIDAVKDSEASNEATYESRLLKANFALKKAERRAFTFRDRVVMLALQSLLLRAKSGRQFWTMSEERLAKVPWSDRPPDVRKWKQDLLAENDLRYKQLELSVRILYLGDKNFNEQQLKEIYGR
jgi:hypothetical protein